ncbi:hypothetical protein B0J13DRAFT_612556, partial [Dactylonectria estremocensis]
MPTHKVGEAYEAEAEALAAESWPIEVISPELCNPNWLLDQGENISLPNLMGAVGRNDDRPVSQQSLNRPSTTASWEFHSTTSLPHQTLSEQSSSHEGQIAAIFEAQTYIQSELGENPRLSHQEREILELAITLSSQASSTKDQSTLDVEGTMTGKADFCDPSMYPSAEAMCYLLSGYRTVAASFHSELASIISRGTFERMAFALIDHEVHGHVRVQYIVCVNFFALTFVVGLEAEGQTPSMQERHKSLQERYRKNAFTALGHISVLNPASLSLLQALLAGLSAAACVVCAQLGGRYFASLASGASEQDSLEVRQCLGHCYILDKSLAMTLGRRSFLPEMEVNAAMLIPPAVDMPSAPIFNIYVEFAKVQDAIARDIRAPRLHRSSEKTDVIKSLRLRMNEIRLKIRKFRLHPPHCTDHLLQGEWMGVDFTYFTIMTTILRLHPSFSADQHVRENCLEHARRALCELKSMEEHGLKAGGHRNAYCLSVAWIVLLYPLCPFFALFCNVVETSDRKDFELLESVTNGLSMFAEANASVRNVQEFCNTLVSLSKTRVDYFSSME